MFKVEGLPEGWKAVCFRVPIGNIEHVFVDGAVREAKPQDKNSLIVEKIHPIRIVLEETDDILGDKQSGYVLHDGKKIKWIEEGWRIAKGHKIWREVKEIAIPLTNDLANVTMGVSQGDGLEPKLELSVKECKEAMRKLETFNVTDLSVKICRFLKDK